VTKRRVEQIEKLQDGIRTFYDEFTHDFDNNPPAISGAVETDCTKALDSLELLKGIIRRRLRATLTAASRKRKAASSFSGSQV